MVLKLIKQATQMSGGHIAHSFTCIIVLSSVRKVHWATTGNAWHTSSSDRGGLVFRMTVVSMSMDVWGTDGGDVRFCDVKTGDYFPTLTGSIFRRVASTRTQVHIMSHQIRVRRQH